MKNKLLILFVAALFLISLASAATNVTKVNQTDAALCINDSRLIMDQIGLAGYNVLRVNDSLRQAVALYDSQVISMEKKKNFDFAIVIPYCDAIKKINDDFITAKDEFSALLQFYNDSLVKGENTASVDVMIAGIRDEITNERYENVKGLTDKTYSEIISVQSSNTALNIFLDSTTMTLSSFFSKNWKVIVTILVLAIFGFLIYRIKILKWIAQRKMDDLYLRKSTLKELMMKTQKDYFQLGKIAEGEYNIKTKKFAELIRDIDRQIPLLKEEIIKLERKIAPEKSEKNKEEKKSEKKVVGFFDAPVIRAVHKYHDGASKKKTKVKEKIKVKSKKGKKK